MNTLKNQTNFDALIKGVLDNAAKTPKERLIPILDAALISEFYQIDNSLNDTVLVSNSLLNGKRIKASSVENEKFILLFIREIFSNENRNEFSFVSELWNIKNELFFCGVPKNKDVNYFFSISANEKYHSKINNMFGYNSETNPNQRQNVIFNNDFLFVPINSESEAYELDTLIFNAFSQNKTLYLPTIPKEKLVISDFKAPINLSLLSCLRYENEMLSTPKQTLYSNSDLEYLKNGIYYLEDEFSEYSEFLEFVLEAKEKIERGYEGEYLMEYSDILNYLSFSDLLLEYESFEDLFDFINTQIAKVATPKTCNNLELQNFISIYNAIYLLKKKLQNDKECLQVKEIYIAMQKPFFDFKNDKEKKSHLNQLLELAEKTDTKIYGVLPKDFSNKLFYLYSPNEIIGNEKLLPLLSESDVQMNIYSKSEFDGNDNFTKVELNLQDLDTLKRYLYACKASFEYEYDYLRLRFKGQYIPTKKLLKTHKNTFENAFKNHKFIQIKASTGIGKTFAIKHFLARYLKKLGYTVVMAAPRNAIAKQQSEKNKYICFTSETNKIASETLHNCKGNAFGNIIFTNYDNIDFAINIVKSYKKKPYLIIDESDQILRDTDFRESQMKDVLTYLDSVEKGMFLSATPIEIDKYKKETFFLELISTTKKEYEKPTMYIVRPKKYDLFLANQIPIDTQKGNKVLVFLDNVEKLKSLKSVLENEGLKVGIFASKDLSESETKKIDLFLNSENQMFETDVILTTQILSAGVNIKSEKDVIIYDCNTSFGFDNDKFLQDIARIRNYDKLRMKYVILTNDKNTFRDNVFLSFGFHFQLEYDLALQNALFLTEQYNNRKKAYGSLYAAENVNSLITPKEKHNSFSVGLNVDFNESKEVFEVSDTKLLNLKFQTKVKNGSPYYFDLKEIINLETENENEVLNENEILKESKEIVFENEKKERIKIANLIHSEMETLLYSYYFIKNNKDVKNKKKLGSLLDNEKIQFLNKTDKSELLTFSNTEITKISKFLTTYLSVLDAEKESVLKSDKRLIFTYFDKDLDTFILKSNKAILKSKEAFKTLQIALKGIDKENKISNLDKEFFKFISKMESCLKENFNSETKELDLKDFISLLNYGKRRNQKKKPFYIYEKLKNLFGCTIKLDKLIAKDFEVLELDKEYLLSKINELIPKK